MLFGSVQRAGGRTVHRWAMCLSPETPVGPGGSEEGMALEPEPHWFERAGEFPPGSCLQLSLCPPGAASREKIIFP